MNTADRVCEVILAIVDCFKEKKAARATRRLSGNIKRMARAVGEGDSRTASLLLKSVVDAHRRRKKKK